MLEVINFISMPTVNASFSRDNDRVPITTDGITISTTQTLTGTGTVITPLFHIIGTVEIRALYGVVTTVIGANHTAGLYRLNDQTAQVGITASGITLSALAVGTTFTKHGLAAAALTLLDNAAGRVSEPTTLETTYFSPFVAMKKTAATTDIEYSFATTDNPTTGAIQHFVRFLPLSADGTIQII
jgi:hypothetical protein